MIGKKLRAFAIWSVKKSQNLAVKRSSMSEISKKTPFIGLFSWCLFDWANSAFSSIVITFIFATYYTKGIAANKIIGTAQWGNAIALASIIIALISPLLGAIADNEGRRKPWLAAFSVLKFAASALLWFALPNENYATYTLTCVILGTIGMEVGMVFYNAMLSSIAPKEYLGRLSGWAWGMGYIGGLVALIIALFVLLNHSAWFGLNLKTSEQVRICGPLVAVWFAIFAWPIFVFTPDQPSTGLGIYQSMRKGLKALLKTLYSVREHKNIMLFLLARMLYTDGLNTVFAFGGIYAAGTFGMDYSHIIIYGITMNISAGIGSAILAWMDDFKGSKFTILFSLVLMIFAGIGILVVRSHTWFWILSWALALCVGPIQAASRSFMIRITPKELVTEMFGLFAFSGKATAFVGPWLLGLVTLWSQSQRIGMTTVMIFLISGAILLIFVKEESNW
jgi:UMF1 family MFS transporter